VSVFWGGGHEDFYTGPSSFRLSRFMGMTVVVRELVERELVDENESDCGRANIAHLPHDALLITGRRRASASHVAQR